MQIYYHASSKQEINLLVDGPIWLSHDIYTAKGWHRLGDNDVSFRVFTTAIIADCDDPKLKAIMRAKNLDLDGYISDLCCNPSPQEVNESLVTVALKQLGYDGFKHIDYDPYDNQRDVYSTMLFDRSTIYTVEQLDWDLI